MVGGVGARERVFHVRTLNRYTCEALGIDGDVYGVAKGNLALLVRALVRYFEGRTLVFLNPDVLSWGGDGHVVIVILIVIGESVDLVVARQAVFGNGELNISRSPFVGLDLLGRYGLVVGIIKVDG